MNDSTKTTPAQLAQTIADRVGGRVIADGGWRGYLVALNDECGTYVARVLQSGEILKLTNNYGRVDSRSVRVSEF